MDTLNRITEFFGNYDPSELPGDILTVVVLSVAMIFMLIYSSSHNAGWYTGLTVAVSLVLIVLVIFGVITEKVTLIVLLAVQLSVMTVLFNAELRRDLFKLSVHKRMHLPGNTEALSVTKEEIEDAIGSIIKAAQSLSKRDTGALMVVCSSPLSDSVTESGTAINADISEELIETLFYPKCPLHDGAVIIIGNKIMSAGCCLNLTQRIDLPKDMGTRHRAALGISEADPTVTVIVVSEETGIISAMRDGKYKRYLDADALKYALEIAYGISENEDDAKFWNMPDQKN